MSTPLPDLEEQLRLARAELGAVLAQSRQELAEFKAANQPTPEEQRELQEAALRGDLGPQMQELAEHVDQGDDSWDAIFSGDSPRADLLQGHLDRMIVANGPAIIQAFEEDEDFDPSTPPGERT